jgi:hypothetical protein
MTRRLVWLAVAALLVAGCLAPSHPAPAPKDTASPAPAPEFTSAQAPAFLKALQTPVKPQGVRALADLEAFTTLAPRRYDGQFQHAAARDWLEQQFIAAGLQTTRFNFTGQTQVPGVGSAEGQDILGVILGQPGHEHELIMFGGHYDSADTAYGAAYDDGSGTLLTLELARALAKYNWTHTIVFAEWDQEEAGLIGSAAYANHLKESGDQVVLYVNFDMTGINWPAKFLGAVDEPLKADFGGPGDAEHASLWGAVTTFLGMPATASTVATGATSGSSDHGSFLSADFPAAWMRGAVIGNYPLYHNADSVQTMITDVGGNRADLEAGFQTALDTSFYLAFLLDQAGVPSG